MSNERILDKIRKCLAMAQDSRGNAAEAANALRQAQALMAKHGLSELDVSISQVGDALFRSKVSVKNPMAWEWGLVNSVCKAFGCKAIFYSGGPEPTNKGWFRIIGPKAYVEVAEYTLVVLMRQCVAARTAYVAGLGGYSRGSKSKLANSFCMAWVAQVYKQITEFADPDGKIEKSVAQYMETRIGPVDEAKAGGRERYSSAMQAGAAAAAGVRLHHGAGMNAANLQIKG